MKTQPQQEQAMPRRAYSYSRFSSSKQRKGTSQERQDEWAQHLATEQGWTLDDTLQFRDKARSGFHGDNLKPTADLTRFLELVERGRISAGSVLIIENLDRLSRQEVDEAYDLFRKIIRSGIWIATRTPQRIYKRESGSFMDLMEPIWSMYLAHEESLKKSVRSAGGWKKARTLAAEQGRRIRGADHPAWLRPAGDAFEPIPERAAVLQHIFALSIQGLGSQLIRKELIRQRVPCWGRSGRWQDQYLRLILRGRQVLGEYQPYDKDGNPLGEPIPGYYPAVIDPETWALAQAAVSGRKRTCGRPAVGFTNLFTGLIFHAETKLPLCIRSHISAGRKYAYLAYARGEGIAIPYPEFESLALDTLAMLRPADVLEPTAESGEREERIAALTARVTALGLRQGQLQAAAADPEQDATPLLPILRQISDDLNRSGRELDGLKLESLTGRAEALTECQSLRTYRDEEARSPEERTELDRRIKAAIPSVVSEIWVQPQKVTLRTQIVHVQIFLRSGARRYVQLLPRKLHGVSPWQLHGHDLRAGAHRPEGQVRDTAGDADTPHIVG